MPTEEINWLWNWKKKAHSHNPNYVRWLSTSSERKRRIPRRNTHAMSEHRLFQATACKTCFGNKHLLLSSRLCLVWRLCDLRRIAHYLKLTWRHSLLGCISHHADCDVRMDYELGTVEHTCLGQEIRKLKPSTVDYLKNLQLWTMDCGLLNCGLSTLPNLPLSKPQLGAQTVNKRN